jgi:hypothetical protein
VLARVGEELEVAPVVDFPFQGLEGQDVLLFAGELGRGLVQQRFLEGEDDRVDPIVLLQREQLIGRLPRIPLEKWRWHNPSLLRFWCGGLANFSSKFPECNP